MPGKTQPSLPTRLELWNEKMPVHATDIVRIEANEFPVHEVTASDDTRAVVMICSERIAVDTTDIISLIKRLLHDRGLQPQFVQSGSHSFLESVSPLYDHVMQRFPGHKAGIIVLVNGREPGEGVQALEEIRLKEGDRFEVVYCLQ